MKIDKEHKEPKSGKTEPYYKCHNVWRHAPGGRREGSGGHVLPRRSLRRKTSYALSWNTGKMSGKKRKIGWGREKKLSELIYLSQHRLKRMRGLSCSEIIILRGGTLEGTSSRTGSGEKVTMSNDKETETLMQAGLSCFCRGCALR